MRSPPIQLTKFTEIDLYVDPHNFYQRNPFTTHKVYTDRPFSLVREYDPLLLMLIDRLRAARSDLKVAIELKGNHPPKTTNYGVFLY